MTEFNPTFPNLQQPMVDPKTGIPTSPWQRFLQHLQDQPPAIDNPLAGPSPFSYTLSTDGALVISGGTVSLVEYSRARVTFTLPFVSGIIPASMGDTIVITYTVAPTLWFIPR